MQSWVHDTSARVFEANLARLTPASREALQPSASGARLKAQPPDFRPLVSTPSGQWAPVHASDNPTAASEAVVARLSTNGEPPLIITIGLGLGYLLDAMEIAGNTTTKVLSIEPVPAIARVMLARRDWTGWFDSGRLSLIIGPDYSGATEAWRMFGPDVLKPPTIMAPLIEREFPDAAARARTVVAQIIAGVQANDEARRQFAGRYLINTLRNLPAVLGEGDAAALKGAFANVPAVVVAAGPSLDANLSTLEALDGRVLIIAVDTALRPLLAAGIRPNIVVGVDPSELNARHLHNLPDTSDVWFVAEASLDPSVFLPFAGRTFTFHVSQHHPWPWLGEHGASRGTLRAWGSVLTTAFDLASEAGCDPIVFAGADLAYSRGLQYCRNTTYEPDWRQWPDDAARAERFKTYLAERPHLAEVDMHGRDVFTSPHYVQFRDWIVSRAGELAGRRVLNVTGAGILHGGAIEQVDGIQLQLKTFADGGDLNARIAAAWSSGADARAGALERLDAALTEGDHLPLEAWLAFGGDTASGDLIAQTISRMAYDIRARTRAAMNIAYDRARFDAGAVSREGAEKLIHTAYAFACTQARAQQAHVLLDLMQRTYPVLAARAATRDAVAAAAVLPRHLRVLDIGCGLGRSMAPLVEAGFDVDGVDVSVRMIELCGADPRFARSAFFLSNGMDCGDAPDGAYDLACALHSFHRIRSRVIRLAMLQSISRALRPGGVVAIQMPFFPDRTIATVPAPNVAWSADVVDEEDAARPGEVWCTPDALPLIYEDFCRSFRDLRVQFVDFPAETLRFGLASHVRLCHVVLSASNDFALAERMYAPITASSDGEERSRSALPERGM